jgi:CHAT domain-containing protein
MHSDSNALILEVFRQDNTLKMGIFQQSELASTLKHYSQCPVSFKEIDTLCREVISILNKANKKDVADPDLIQGLQKTGQFLWDQLLTRTVKDKLKNTQILDLVISLDEELINIPWELLYDGADFLCLKFNLGRLVRTKGEICPTQYRSAQGTLKMLILANPTADLKSAYLEGINIKNQFDRKRNAVRIDFKSHQIDTFYIKKNLRDYDLVHFAGHCEYDPDNPKGTGWLLDDGRFTAQDILAMGQTASLPTLVFSNACHSAKVTADLLDSDYQEKAYSLASAFLFSGVRHYIGTIRKIEDSASLNFAQEFYTQLISGRSVGESLRIARLSLIKEDSLASMSWASYLLYGDPNFVLLRAKAKPAPLNLKKELIWHKYKKHLIGISLAMFVILIGVSLYRWLPSLNPNTYVLFLQSNKLNLKGKNQEVVLLASRLIQKDPMFLAAYPLLADTYLRLGDNEKALKYYFDYALYSEKRRDKKHLASAYIGIAWVYQQQGEYPKAFDFYNKALTLSQDNQDRLNEAKALRKLAIWYMDKEDYGQALELLTKSSEINRERQHLFEHRYNLACDYFDIGLVFCNKDDFATAKEFYEKSRMLFEKLKLKNELSDYYFNLGEVYLFQKEYQKALDYYLRGLKIDEDQGNKPSIASDYNMLGELYVEMDNLAEAEKFFNLALSACSQIDAPPELATTYYNLGLLYKNKGRKNKALNYLRLAQEIYSRINTPEYQMVKKEILDLQ